MLLLPYAPPPVVVASAPFDAIGSGDTIGNGSWTHTAAAGAQVLAFITGSGTITMTYGVTSMTLLGTAPDLNGASGYLFGLAGVPGGAKTVSCSGSEITGNSISYTGISSVGTPQTYQSASVTTLSQSVTCTAGQFIVQSFEAIASTHPITSSTGGISRWNDGIIGLTIRDATANTTFTATMTGADHGAGIAVVLS
jgi:hypothetical protein